MHEQPDHQQETWLIQQARQDPQAFRELYAVYFPRVYAYVAYRIGTAQDVEDLVADIFLRVVQQLDRFTDRGRGSFAAWVFRIAHNLVSDFYRHHRRHPDPQSAEELPEIRENLLLPIDSVLRKERFAELRQLIDTLSPRRQEVITLKFFGGLRNKEIAEILGIEERAVASHLSRGLRDLHQKYVAAFPHWENLHEPIASIE